jgi:hypothetical protein
MEGKVSSAVERLHAALLAIEGRAMPTQTREGRGAVDMEWAYRCG